jgi:hypothetical protein
LLSHRIGFVALLSLSLSPLVRRRPPPSYRAAAASLLIVAPPLPSLSCRWFCFRRCATAAFLEAMSAVDDCCVTPKFAMIFLSAVTVKLRPFLPARVPPHASNSSPASPIDCDFNQLYSDYSSQRDVIDDLKAQLANNNADLISEFQENITSLEEATEEASWTDWRQSEEIRRLSQPEREVGPNS